MVRAPLGTDTEGPCCLCPAARGLAPLTLPGCSPSSSGEGMIPLLPVPCSGVCTPSSFTPLGTSPFKDAHLLYPNATSSSVASAGHQIGRGINPTPRREPPALSSVFRHHTAEGRGLRKEDGGLLELLGQLPALESSGGELTTSLSHPHLHKCQSRGPACTSP